jgi:putative ABC transport system permease protein
LYAVFTGIAGFVLSSIFSAVLIRPFGAEMWYFEWNLSLLPVAVVFPIMIALTLLLPVIIYKTVMKTSVVSRLNQVGQ